MDARQDRPVAEGERAELRARRVVSELVCLTQLDQRRPQSRVVRVQEIAAYGRSCGTRRHGSAGEAIERDRRVVCCPREPRRRPELADEEPAARRRDVATPSRSCRLRVRRRENRRPHGAARRGERPPRRARSAAASALSAVRSAAGSEPSTSPTSRRAASIRSFAPGGVAEHQRSLRVRERQTDVARGTPGCDVGGRGRGGEQEARRHDCGRGTYEHYCAILTLSRAAACVTCPAIAVARPCAVRPRESACSGVKRRPARSCCPQLRDERPQAVELTLRLRGLLRVDRRDRRLGCPRR